MNNIKIKIKPLETFGNLPLPVYATPGSSGMDILACVEGEIIIQPKNRLIVSAGFGMAIPEGYEAQIRPRSGNAINMGLTVLNTPGTIDSDYRGEVKVILFNSGDEKITIKRGMKIAQMVIMPVIKAEWEIVSNLPKSERGEGGFGSSGSYLPASAERADK